VRELLPPDRDLHERRLPDESEERRALEVGPVTLGDGFHEQEPPSFLARAAGLGVTVSLSSRSSGVAGGAAAGFDAGEWLEVAPEAQNSS
jgi:hypothetical protein